MNKKILIIGFGEIAQRHYRNLRFLLPGSEIAILNKNKNLKYKKIIYFKNLDDAKKFNPNITLICSPAPSHIRYATIFSKLNSNIFIEKPVATKVDELKKFLKLIKNKKITLLSGYNLRFEKSFVYFQKIIKSKKLGKILSVRSEVGQYLPSWRNKVYTKTVSANKNLGGGAINELSHDVDVLLMLFKNLKLIYGINLNVSNLKVNAEDSAHAIFRSNYNKKNFYIFLNIDFYRHDHTRTCTVIGTKATLRWDGILNEVKIHKKNSKKPTLIKFNNNKNDSYLNEMKFFLKNIEKRNTLYNNFKENLNLIKILKLMKKNKK